MSELCVISQERHRIRLGLKVGDPKVNFKGGWDCVLRFPIKHGSSPNYVGASHGTVRFLDLISAQPAWSQSSENDCIKTAWNRTAKLVMEIDQPRSEPCSTPQEGTGWCDIAESRSRVSMTWSIVSKSLITWGRMPHNKTTMSWVPSLERPMNRVIIG